jgi:epoxide hydrolase-like predicted phosphatase
VSGLRAVISDFGGVLTTPLFGAFARVQEESGVPAEALGRAMVRIEAEDGVHPLWELEKGHMSEPDFLARLERAAGEELGRPVSLNGFAELWWSHLAPNDEVIDFMRDLRARGYEMALLTNNVREWEPRWRALLPVDEIFSVVVDSGFVGMRKPEPGIYELTVERLGVPAADCLFLDDIELNCDAARLLGMTAVVFRDTAQAIAECEAALGI